MDQEAIVWNDFAPTTSGSFGYQDMGTFCNVQGTTFILSFMDIATNKLERQTIELMIKELFLTNAKIEEAYEYQNNAFTDKLSADWNMIISKSFVTSSRWQYFN